MLMTSCKAQQDPRAALRSKIPGTCTRASRFLHAERRARSNTTLLQCYAKHLCAQMLKAGRGCNTAASPQRRCEGEPMSPCCQRP